MKWSLLGWTRSANPTLQEQSSVPEPATAAMTSTDAPSAIVAAEATATTEDAPTGVSTVRAVLSEATGEDYEAWNYHLAHRNPLARRPGTTIRDEYEQFMVSRIRSRPVMATKTIEPEAHPASSPEPPKIALVTELVTAKDMMPSAQALAPTLLLNSPEPCRSTV